MEKQLAIGGKVIAVSELRDVTAETIRKKLKKAGVQITITQAHSLFKHINEHEPTKAKLAREAEKQNERKEK